MKNIFKLLAFISITILFTACSSKIHLYKPAKVEIDRYLGTWYEIARYEHF